MKIIIKCSITVSVSADLQAEKRVQTVLSVSPNLLILWANVAVLNIMPYIEVLVRQMSLENPMEKALACHLEIGSPTVSLRMEKDWEKGEHARHGALRCTPRGAPCLVSPVWGICGFGDLIGFLCSAVG